MDRRNFIKLSALITGIGFSDQIISSVWRDCLAATPNEEKHFFTMNKWQLVNELADTILPRTETPGAKDIGVTDFIDRLLAFHAYPEEQNSFQEGLQSMEKDCIKRNGKPFISCKNAEREDFISHQEKISGQFPASHWGMPVEVLPTPETYRVLKGMVIQAYFNSHKIAELLKYGNS